MKPREGKEHQYLVDLLRAIREALYEDQRAKSIRVISSVRRVA